MIWACALLYAASPANNPVVVQQPLTGPVLRSGTRVLLTIEEPLSSRTAREGQRIRLRVSDDVRVDGLLVIPKGAPATGEVSRVVEKGIFGKSGKLRVRALFVDIAGTRIRIDGERREKGQAGTAPMVVAAPLIGISAGFFSGTSANIPAGAPIDAYVWKDVPLMPAPATAD